MLVACILVAVAAPKKFTLVIDAGHGGHDAGAVGAYSKEKDINLRTALAFGKYVERNCPDVNVIYTRKTDVFVTLHGRADIANHAKADLFISIHTNSLPAGHNTARGMETYTLGMHRAADNLDVAKRENSVILVEKNYQEHYQGFDPNSSESYIIFELMQDNNMQRSVELAKLVQQHTCSLAGRPNKGVKQAGFLVLRETSMPSCLIELGFISTPNEERLLNDDAQVENIARGIYNAFVAYKQKMDPEVDVPYRPEVAVERPKEPEKVTEPVKPAEKPAVVEKTNEPLFKVQIFVAEKQLKATDARFKGEKETDYYKEGGMVKYTIGASTDYNEIFKLRKTLLAKFPDCFIVAFRNGEKMNVNEAIREFKNRK